MRTDRHEARIGEGRRVVIWRSFPDQLRPDAPVVTLSPGFARRMRDVGGIALCLVTNGAIVYRFDSVDHLGLSDGDIANFSVKGIYESWRATIELAREIEGRQPVRMVALSLSAVAAFRLAAEDAAVENVTALSGVVDGKATLARVIGTDYSLFRYEDLPHRVKVLNHEVDPRGLWLDYHRSGYLSLERTASDLEAISAPVSNFLASSDPWVDVDECEFAFQNSLRGQRSIIRLPYSGHDLGHNPIAMMALLERLTLIALRETGTLNGGGVVAPTFEQFLDVRVVERRREAEEREAFSASEGSCAG